MVVIYVIIDCERYWCYQLQCAKWCGEVLYPSYFRSALLMRKSGAQKSNAMAKLSLSQYVNATRNWCCVIGCQEVHTDRPLVGISLLTGSLHHIKKRQCNLLKTVRTSSTTWWCLRLQCHSDGLICLKCLMVGILIQTNCYTKPQSLHSYCHFHWGKNCTIALKDVNKYKYNQNRTTFSYMYTLY